MVVWHWSCDTHFYSKHQHVILKHLHPWGTAASALSLNYIYCKVSLAIYYLHWCYGMSCLVLMELSGWLIYEHGSSVIGGLVSKSGDSYNNTSTVLYCVWFFNFTTTKIKYCRLYIVYSNSISTLIFSASSDLSLTMLQKEVVRCV